MQIDNMEFHSEGGLELLSRFNQQSRSINPDKVLFSGDISNDSVIEIVGEPSSGKTLLLCQFLAKCILPAQYEEIEIDGCDACAILIDTLGHILISKITELMNFIVNSACQAAGIQLSVEVVDSIIFKSLENLSVISCCNSDQFQLALYTLEDELLGNKRIALVAIDNLLGYYWEVRRKKGLFSMDSYMKNLVQIIRSHISQFKIMTVYTRWDESGSESESQVKRTSVSEGTCNYRLQLRKSNKNCEFVCHVESTDSIKQCHYTICGSGIKWILQ